jgi:hypothetical protein
MGLRLTKNQFNNLINNKQSNNKKNKYNNKKITINGITDDSKKEYDRHCILKTLEKSGKIRELKFHETSMNIILQKTPQIKYEPDFCYYENNIYIIEDVKGYQTKEFKLKKKLIINKLNNNEIVGIFRLTKYSKTHGFEIIEEYKSESIKRNTL